jgi:hypothetical protein
MSSQKEPTEKRRRSATGPPTHNAVVTMAHRPIVWKSGNIEKPVSSAVSDSREM